MNFTIVKNSLKEKNIIIQLLFFLTISLIINESVSLFLKLFYGEEVFKLNFESYESLYEILFEVVVLAPILETIFIQFFLIELFLLIFSKLKKDRKYLYSVFLVAIIFGALHQYNTAYMIVTFLLGLIWGAMYIFFKFTKNINPILALIIVHSVHNFINLLIEYEEVF